MLPDETPDEPRENNAALQFVDEEEEGWDDDDFDLSEDLDPPAPAGAPTPREAPHLHSASRLEVGKRDSGWSGDHRRHSNRRGLRSAVLFCDAQEG